MAEATSSVPSSAPSPGPSGTKLFLGGLSWETTEEKLRDYFAKYGEIQDVVVMKDKITKHPRHFGFITFKEISAAEAACQETHTIDGRTIDAKPSVPHAEGSKKSSRKIFVGGLAADTTEEQFRNHFSQFGKVVEATIMVDHTSGRSRGFGFVTFEDEASAQKVFSAGPMQQLGGKQVEIKSATPKGSGPQGRGAGAGRGGRGFGFPGGRGYGLPPGPGYMGYGYPPAPGYGQGYGYGGYGPYGGYGAPFPGYAGYGAAGYGPAPYGFGQQGYGQQGYQAGYGPTGGRGRGGV